MAISFVVLVTLVSFGNEHKKWRAQLAVCWLSCVVLITTPPPPPSLIISKEVLSLFAMPKVDPRNEVGAIVHAVSNRVLSDHTAKNIYGNVNYAKTFLQGTVINVFDGRTPGGKNAVWKLTVDFEMHSEEPTLGVELKRVAVHRQHCTLGPVPAGELNQLARAGAIFDCLRISVASSPPRSHLAVNSPPLSSTIVIISTAVTS